MTNILINELYNQLTFQGEGPSTGRLCSFIRFFGCPLHCCFCDTYWTWRISDKYSHNFATDIIDPKVESRRMTIGQIIDHFIPMNPPMLVITGGEPMLQAEKLPELIESLMEHLLGLNRIEIETAGTIFSEEVAELPYVYFNVSPKLENSGNSKELRYRPDVLIQFRDTYRANFKFVICDLEDLNEVQEIVDEVGIPNERVWIMPEGITSQVIDERTQYLTDEVLKRRWNLTTRLHILLFGNKRGV